MAALNDGMDDSLVESWFWLNLTQALGEEINLYRDVDGKKLLAENKYIWDTMAAAFAENINGDYGTDEIKVLRLISTTDLDVIARVKNINEIMPKILKLVRVVSKI